MCGFLVDKGQGDNRQIQKRGQDLTNVYEKKGFRFIHNLLSITGEMTPQPFIKDEIICLYNGEIYNHPFEKSDGENLIPLYRKNGVIFPRELDGEFAIALYDFGKDIAFFITDPFATKPIWRNGNQCASYESGVGGHKIKANTIEAVEISTGKDLYTINYHQWDWQQFKDNYDDCLRALEKAVLKRYKPGCFIGLSSGYDSGTIASILKGRDFKCYAVIASEDRSIISQRADILGNVDIIENFDIKKEEEHLRESEEFFYDINYDSGRYRGSYKEDYASKALSHICRKAREEGRRVYLSGAGADEILSDYSLIPNQSELKGKFPDHLKEWKNFTDNCMYSYLGKEEYVGGSWSIETRYPFLDREFIQEFLWMKPELKNRNYKAPLYEYLTKANFPTVFNKKIGFSIN